MIRRRIPAWVVASALFLAPVAAFANPDPQVPEAYIPDRAGIPTVQWEAIGFTKAAVERFPDTACPVAVGLLRMWVHASASQRSSKEYQATFQAVNQELLRSDCVMFR